MYLLLLTVTLVGISTLGTANTPPALREYIYAPGKLMAPIPRNSMMVQSGSSVEMCAAKCTIYFRTKKFPCYAFEYTTGTRMCVFTNMTTLMKENGFLSLKDNSNGVDYYERSKASFKNLFRVIPNAAIRQMESYYLIKKNATVEECARDCHVSHTQTCMSFSFAQGSGVCGLSNKFWVKGDTNGISLMSTAVYDHYQYYTAWPCNATLPPDYNPHALASPKFPYLSVTNIDCHVTLEAHPGERIQFTIPTFFTTEDICREGDSGLMVYDGMDDTASVISHLCNKQFRDTVVLNSTTNYLYIRYKTENRAIAFKALYDFIPGSINTCLNNHCTNGASCVNGTSSYTCACVPGFTGRFCEANINDCDPSPCYFGGKCVDEVNDYHCECARQFGGKNCEKYLGKCADHPCEHGECRVLGRDGYTCRCHDGYTGINCSIRLPACLSNPCVHGTCVNNNDGFYCQCPRNYAGTKCEKLVINPCASNPCAYGNCTITDTDFLCQCNRGFTGSLCNTVIDHCQGVHCNHGTCINELGGHRCICHANYSGADCNVKDNACVDVNCGHGTCQLTQSGFTCICESGFMGSDCSMAVRDHCSPSPCKHGNCTSDAYGYTCTCQSGYQGVNCDIVVNHCNGQDCGFGICDNSPSGFTCLCAQGYEGAHCERQAAKTTTPPPVCRSNPCQNGGICRGHAQTFACDCQAPFGGTFCQINYTPCLTDPCQNNGTCAPLGNDFLCLCPEGTTGVTCEALSACASDPCRMGQCVENKDGSFKCQMPSLVGHSNTTSSLPNHNVF